MGRAHRLPLAIAFVAALPRAVAALVRPPWHDEYFTVWAARLPLADLLDALHRDSGPPLPYLLVKWLAALGLAPLPAARLLALAAGTAAVLLAWRAARLAVGERPALVLAGVLAFHPLAVTFGSEGRAYGLLFLGVAWAWERCEAIREQGRGVVGLALAVALACWSHGLGAVVGLAAASAAATLPPRLRRRALGAVAVGLASSLPWLPVALRQPAAATTWMLDAWRTLTLPERLAAPLRLLPPLAPFHRTLDLPAFPVPTMVLAAAACLVLLLAARPPATVLLVAAVPAGGLAILAHLGAPTYYPGRAEALFLAPALALVAAGVARGRWRWAAAAFLVAAAALASTSALHAWRHTPPAHEEVLAAAVAARYGQGATVVASGHWWLDLASALEKYGPNFTVLPYPACVATHPGWYDPAHCRPTSGEAEALYRRLISGDGAVAVIVAAGTPLPRELSPLAARLGLSEALRLPAATLWLAPPP